MIIRDLHYFSMYMTDNFYDYSIRHDPSIFFKKYVTPHFDIKYYRLSKVYKYNVEYTPKTLLGMYFIWSFNNSKYES